MGVGTMLRSPSTTSWCFSPWCLRASCDTQFNRSFWRPLASAEVVAPGTPYMPRTNVRTFPFPVSNSAEIQSLSLLGLRHPRTFTARPLLISHSTFAPS